MNQKAKTLTINIGVALLGALTAVGLFFLLNTYLQNEEKKNLVPKALTARENKEYSLAISLFQEAEQNLSKEDVNYSKIDINLAQLFFLKGKYEEAQKYYMEAGESAWSNDDYNNLGQIALAKNDLENVLKYWSKESTLPKNKFQVAQIYYSKGDLTNYFATLKQISSFREPQILLQIEETDLGKIVTNLEAAQSYPSLGGLAISTEELLKQFKDAKFQLDSGKKDYADLIQISAFSELNQCKVLNPKITTLKTTLATKKIPNAQLDYFEGKCANEFNEPDKAIALINNAINSDKTMVAYREALAQSYFLKSDAEKIQEIYANILTIEKQPKYSENLGYYMLGLNKYSEALNAYKQANLEYTSTEDKQRVSEIILEIALTKTKQLAICKEEAILQNINPTTTSEKGFLLKGVCMLESGNFTQIAKDTKFTLAYKYLEAVNAKDKTLTQQILDKDETGVITLIHTTIYPELTINKSVN